jgi:hypothetical protein
MSTWDSECLRRAVKPILCARNGMAALARTPVLSKVILVGVLSVPSETLAVPFGRPISLDPERSPDLKQSTSTEAAERQRFEDDQLRKIGK